MQLLETLLPPFAHVPAGTFLMGTPEAALSDLARQFGGTRESYREESPAHKVMLPSFAIATLPVTNRLYHTFVTTTGAQPPLLWHSTTPPDERLDHPVVDISFPEARAFAAWLAAEVRLPLRLPSEAEWERAARGTDGREYPWGTAWDDALANTREAGRGGTTVPGTLPNLSPVGCYDLAGNVWEWTCSLDRRYPYDPADGREDPTAPGRRIMRGGCYANPRGYARCACRFRLPPDTHNEFLGFRLAYTLP